MRISDWSSDVCSSDLSPKNALLVECGQHWERSSADVAIESTFRFLRHLDVIAPETAEPHIAPDPPPQRFIEVTEAVTIRSNQFEFAGPYVGLEVIPKAGSVLGTDGGNPVRTPYDDCVLIMPSRRLHAGQTAA